MKIIVDEISALKSMVKDEAKEASCTTMGTMPLRWVPTQKQLADALTKLMDGKDIRQAVETGRISLVEDPTVDPSPLPCLVASSLSHIVHAIFASHIQK